MTTVSVVRAATAAAVATTQVVAFHNRSNRRQVKDFNDCITCSLCGGYLIEATTIDDCVHTFCRSCIVRYLESNKYCPKCKSYNNKTIKMANLRPDRILKSLVYKLVPGLYKSENQRVAKFFAEQSQDEHCGSRKPPDHGYLEDQNFFSPDELICLKLEYHYNSIADYDPKSTKLPITHLRCPAAVTIHHLYKFILTKNGLQLGNERIQVDIIYEDEVLPHDFTLMDVAYCFDYKRVSQMRLFYRIFIHPTAKPTPAAPAYNVGSDKNSNENNNNSGGGGERSANNSHSTDANLNESQGSASSSPSSSPTTSSSPQKGKKCDSSSGNVPSKSEIFAKPDEVVDKAGSSSGISKSVASVEKANYIKSANSCVVANERKCVETSEKSNTPPSEASCYKAVESKYDSKLIITKTNKVDKSGGEKREKETLKLVLVSKKSGDRNDAKIVYSKSDSKSSKSPKQNSPSSSAGFSDFKRLRSNDIRYSDYESPSSSSSVSSKATAGGSKSGTVPDDDSRKFESQNVKKHNKINNDHNNISDSSGKKFCEDNSRGGASGTGNEANSQTGNSNAAIPTQSVLEAKTKHEKSKSSPRRYENNGAAVAITASTSTASVEKSEKTSELKCYVNLKKQMVVSPLSSSAETSANRKPEVPKLKIELPSLKTKISIPRSDNEKSPKSVHTSSASSSAATSPAASSSNSGKSPIWPKADDSVRSVDAPQIGIEEYAKTIGLKPVQKMSEGGEVKKKKKSSTSTSPDPSFHRKRKKAKHSKEAGSKRRKLHAEISSQHDESLKMKVKLTEKPSKHERKASEEITPQSPKEPTKQNAEVTSSSLPPSASPPSSSAAATAAASSTVTPTVAVAPIPSPKEDAIKVIDITKGDDDDDVKIIEHPTLEGLCPPPSVTTTEPVKSSVGENPTATVAMRVNELPKLPECSTKSKINEMRAIRHKPMVYIPNLDKNLSDNSSTINSIIESVQAKTGFIDKDSDVQVVLASKSGPENSGVPKLTLSSVTSSKATSAVTTMRPPAMVLSPASSRTANGVPRPPHRMAVQQQVFSPRHTPNYPPLVLQSSPKKVTPTNSTNTYQPRNANPALKRSTSVDSGSTYNIPPKTPRVDLMELNAQNRLMKKPIYAPMFNFVKGANLAKNGNASMLISANDVPYKSSISSSYTKEINAKKSVPSLLLPPSSISVTKMTDSVPQPPPVDNRPALEIVRIPSTAPVADKPQSKSPPVAQKITLTPKTTRPPPPTIPLIKIKKSASVPEQASSPLSPSVFQVTSSNASTATNLSTSSASHQDTSGALDLTTRASDDLIILESSDSLTPKLNNGNESKQRLIKSQPGEPHVKPNSNARIEIDSSRLELINSLIQTSASSMIKVASGSNVMAAKFHSSGIPGLKLPADMIGFAISSPSNNVPKLGITYSSAPTSTIKSIPMPKLTEINRNRNVASRQPNPSVRSIPNPSALAFRNQTIAISSSSCVMPTASFSLSSPSPASGTITSLSPTSPAKIMNVNMKINNASSTAAGQKSSVNYNGINSSTSSSSSIADTFPSIGGSSSRTYTSAINTTSTTNTNTTITISSDASSEVVSSNLNGNNNNNNSCSITNNNKGDSGVSSTSGSGKKTIEKVAAGLKAAAATATASAASVPNASRVSSNGNTTGGINKNGVNVV